MVFRLFRCDVCGKLELPEFKWDSLPLYRKVNMETQEIEKVYCSPECSLKDHVN